MGTRFVVVLAVLALAAPARAGDPTAEARRHVATADTEYKLGQFEQALAEYSAAYQLFASPALLFNIGQCHRNLKHYEQALFFYRGFLRDAPADAPNRATVEGLVRDTQADLDRQHADEAKAKQELEAREHEQDELKRSELDARQRAEQDRQVAEARRQAVAQPHQPAEPIYDKWWFWAACGGAAVAAGATVYYFAGGSTVEPSGSLGNLDRR